MHKDDEEFRSRVGQALGASRVVTLSGLPSGGPLDLLQLRADVARRLKSTGGRPTDPEWDTQRLVPFRGERWKQLERLAEALSTKERKVSPGQLAAILLDRVLEDVQSHPKQR
jgi:hypothetical protein